MTDHQSGAHDAWSAFAEQYDAFLGRPRRDHGLPSDPAGLGRAILAQPDLSAGALRLREQLVEQLGPHDAHGAWLRAWEWIREHHQAMASAQLDQALDGLIAMLRNGDEDGDGLLAEAGSLLEDLAVTDPGPIED